MSLGFFFLSIFLSNSQYFNISNSQTFKLQRMKNFGKKLRIFSSQRNLKERKRKFGCVKEGRKKKETTGFPLFEHSFVRGDVGKNRGFQGAVSASGAAFRLRSGFPLRAVVCCSPKPSLLLLGFGQAGLEALTESEKCR